ncbi:MAG: hypothetical protein ACRCZF_19410, partial [Gemmataceae bacterium]
ASVGVWVLRLTLVILAFFFSYRWRTDPPRAWSAAIVLMLLASPITWAHYFLLLLQPLALVWMRARGIGSRLLFWIVFILMLLPQYQVPTWILGRERGAAWTHMQHTAFVSAGENLYAASLLNYALVVLLLLIVGACRLMPSPSAPRSVS